MRRPAMARRIVTYDLSDEERQRVKVAAEADGRGISRWIADALREHLSQSEIVKAKMSDDGREE